MPQFELLFWSGNLQPSPAIFSCAKLGFEPRNDVQIYPREDETYACGFPRMEDLPASPLDITPCDTIATRLKYLGDGAMVLTLQVIPECSQVVVSWVVCSFGKAIEIVSDPIMSQLRWKPHMRIWCFRRLESAWLQHGVCDRFTSNSSISSPRVRPANSPPKQNHVKTCQGSQIVAKCSNLSPQNTCCAWYEPLQ